ncbi:tyrosinase family protein [Oscillatoria sp. CS-180]|uniref:tyrosinase family protein n=1 Tax=Oscillatoria sp. CS-180 TaxID=3021720 RepID=UPI00232B462B|nr:tyrosinase family protein [Oscillatoria sp. CS-180]MDB9527114.1 tyrosinase family protein [Oscillatoria sp. CS-180]
MAVRKSITRLSPSEKAQFVQGVKLLKANGTYDTYVSSHVSAMATATPAPGETPNTATRNAAHRGPAFLPWHREFILRFEQDLQGVLSDPDFGLPYWDWAADASLPDSTDPLRVTAWRNDLLGGDGSGANNHVTTGPFAHDPGDPDSWTIVSSPGDPAPFLKRTLGRQVPTLGTQDQVNAALAVSSYDESPWDTSSAASQSFRNHLEGFVPSPPGLHNRGHVWVGGSMLPGTSPNDPVFFLHHCNVDRIWALWQACNPTVPYIPDNSVADAPPGHRLNDRMFPWTGPTDRRIADLLDIATLGYSYDDFHRRFVRLRRTTGDRFVSDQVIEIRPNCDRQNDTASTVFLPATPGATIRAQFEQTQAGPNPGDVVVLRTLTDEIPVNP